MAVRARQPEGLRNRIERLFLAVAVAYLVLVARLVYIQAINGGYYRFKAQRMRAQSFQQVSERGAIVDRDWKLLAVTVHSTEIVCDPCKVSDAANAANSIAQILGVTPDQVLPYLSRPEVLGEPGRHSVKLSFPVGPDAVQRFRVARTTRAGAKSLAGISLVDIVGRSFPAGREAVHVVGTVKLDEQNRHRGVMGIEQSLDETLRGTDGNVLAELDARRRMIAGTQLKSIDKQDGLDVKLTLDATIQHIVQGELQICCEKYHPVGATAIVVDPKTGDILSLVSYPNFDPVKREELKNGSNEALRNYALTLFEPGSTMKIITAAAALQDKVITSETPFNCGGHLTVGNRTISCASHGGSSAHGHETISGIIAHSCNVASAQIGVRVGMDRMRRYLESFGLLDQSGVDLPMDPRGRLGFGAEALVDSDAKTSRVAFGQSVMVTPLGMAMAYSAIANHGVLMKPRLVSGYYDSNGRLVKRVAPEAVRQVIEPQTADYLASLLQGVVDLGTGKAAAVPGYTVAGKTGTAQKVVPGQHGYAHGKYVASFIGFMPVKDPKVLIYVVVDEPKGAYYGAQVAAPVFQAVGQRLLWYLKVPPDDPASLDKSRSRLARD